MRNGAYFYLVPSGVVESNVSDSAKLTYAVILGLSDRYGYCFATNKKLAEIRMTSESTLKRHIKELTEAKLITTEYNHRNDRRITPNIYPMQREKIAKNAKNVAYTTIDSETENILDSIFKKM